jgi:predicted lysophospholipase L1 biosynthesis ABC-type transport system permease subunit
MAANEFGGRDALGQRISLEEGHDVEVVGVVSDARIRSIRGNAEPIFFLPAAQPHGIPARLALDNVQVRALGDPSQLAEQVRHAVSEAQSDLALLNIRTLSEQVDRTLVRERLLALLASAFGLGALFLVAVGLYGVISQWATQRTREIGVRVALGATPFAVQWLVLRQALWLVLIGLGLGIPAAIAVARLLTGLLFEVLPLDPSALIGSALVLVAVATSAAFLPARRASRVDPVTALRSD